MNIFDNPFYILGTSLYANRKEISALADEKSLLNESDKVTVARNVLMNPRKRLAAEIRWFSLMNINEEKELYRFFSDLRAGKRPKEPDFAHPSDLNDSKVSIITILNIKINELLFLEYSDGMKIKDLIVNICKVYELLNKETLVEDINIYRGESGFPPLSGTAEIDEELRNYRGEIKTLISQKLLLLPQEQIIKFVTMLSEKYISSDDYYNGSAIIDDILSEYELHINTKIQDQKQEIINVIGIISKSVDRIRLDESISSLIRLVKQWSELVHPLQLVAQGKGQEHPDSELVAYAVRGLVIELHNKHGKTAEALLLANAIKSVFAELSEFSERIGVDADSLEKIKQVKDKEEMEEKEAIRRNRFDMVYSVTLNSDKIMIPPCCTCCMKPTDTNETISTSVSQTSGNTRRTRTISMSLPLCQDCLNHRKKASSMHWLVIFLSVGFSIASIPVFVLPNGFYANWYIPFIVVVLAYVFWGSIIKLPELSSEHSTRQKSVWLDGIGMKGNTMTYIFTNWRYAKLFAELNGYEIQEIAKRNKAKLRAYLKTIDYPGKIFFTALIITTFVFFIFYQNSTNLLFPKASNVGSTDNYSDSLSYSGKQTKTAAKSNATDIPKVTLAPVAQPNNGYIFYNNTKERICPFEVITTGNNAYYIKLVDINTHKDAIRFFVRPDQSVKLEVPLGKYEMRYAMGDTWYGEKNLFGSTTTRYKANTILEFTRDSKHVYGHTVELYLQTNGNLETSAINASDF